MMNQSHSLLRIGIACLLLHSATAAKEKMNVLFIIADDLTATAVSSYEKNTCQTPNIDRLAERGTLYSRAYCQVPYCGPSRASLMSGYYPQATGVMGYVSGRKAIGDKRMTWAQNFKNAGYYTARVSKIFHMGVPIDIEQGSNGQDDPASWTERFNSQGPEWKAKGDGELLEHNPHGDKPVKGGNTMVKVEADGDDLEHSDGRTAQKACELIKLHKDEPFFLAVGFVRPHVPFVSPRKYYEPYPHEKVELPKKLEGDWDDIPKAGINYKTSKNLNMNIEQQKKAVAAYYASVAYMDAQVGKVLDTLEQEGLAEKTIVIFTSDHGFHLGEHDFWMKVSLLEESARVPLIICVPGKKPAVCDSFAELIDLYQTTSELCGLSVSPHLQGKSLVKTLDNPSVKVRDAAYCSNPKGFLIRDEKWAYIQYKENASKGIELFNMEKDPKQYHNLAKKPEYAPIVKLYQAKLADKLRTIRDNDLERPAKKK
jgi:iduronate 2-sulfatase